MLLYINLYFYLSYIPGEIDLRNNVLIIGPLSILESILDYIFFFAYDDFEKTYN